MSHTSARRVAHTMPAFTLVELLVSLGIITVVIGLVLPGVNAAGRRSRQVQCLSNLRQLDSACAAYATSDENTLVLPAHPISDRDALHQDGWYDWGGATGHSNGWGGTYSPAGPRTAPTRPLNRQIYGSATGQADYRVFRCPDDPGPAQRQGTETWWWTPDFAERPYFWSVGNSYWGNALRRHDWDDSQALPPFLIMGVFLRPASRIPSPAETVLLSEASARVWRSGKYPETYRYGISRKDGWHGKGDTYNIAYADGHVGAVTFDQDFSRGNWRADPDGYGYWVRQGQTRWDCRPEPLLEDPPTVAHVRG